MDIYKPTESFHGPNEQIQAGVCLRDDSQKLVTESRKSRL